MFKKGTSVVTYAFACYFKENKRRFNRCGIVTSKKIGNAVKRSRSRRLIREAFRLTEPELRQKTDKRYDFIFVARGATPSLKSGKVQALMTSKLVPMVLGTSGKTSYTSSGKK